MRPTKEMILETKALIDRTDKSIQEIIKENDMKMSRVRHSDGHGIFYSSRLLVWIAILSSAVFPFLLYNALLK